MSHIALQDYLSKVEGLLEENRLEEASAHCYSILQQQPRHVATYRLFGRVLLEQQKYRQAIDIFQRVLSADPEDLIAHAGLAETYRAMDDLPRSIWHMERAFEIQPYNRAVQIELSDQYEQRDGFAPEQVSLTRSALARLYARGGHYRLAADELQSLLADQPERIDLRVLLAEALFWDDRRLEAAQICADILNELPDCIKANAILAEAWSNGGRESEARPFIEHLWALTLLAASERSSETLIGRAFRHADFASLPEQILVEELDFVPASIEEVVESPEPERVSTAVAVHELPGWLEELDNESASYSERDADRLSGEDYIEEEESDSSQPLFFEGEIFEPPEVVTREETPELEDWEVDPTETLAGEAMAESLAQDSVKDLELSDPVESIDADTTLLLESEADVDMELRSDEGVFDLLHDESVGEDAPIESAETLVGEYEVAQEEAPDGAPEQPNNASVSEEVSAEDSEEVGGAQTVEEHVMDDGTAPGDVAPVESEYSPEDLFLESIVAEAFAEMAPTEPPESEPVDSTNVEEGASAWDSDQPRDDNLLKEIAAEAFEEEMAGEAADETAPETLPTSLQATSPEQASPPDVLDLEETAPETSDVEAQRSSDDDGGPSTDLLFAALATRKTKDQLQEETFPEEDAETEWQAPVSTLGHEGEQSAEDTELDLRETSLEDDIFGSLVADLTAIDQTQTPEADDADGILDQADNVTEEFDDDPETYLPADIQGSPEGAGFGVLAEEVVDEDEVHEQAAEAARHDSITVEDHDAETETRPEKDYFGTDLMDEALILGQSDIVTKEFDAPPDAWHEPAGQLDDELASEVESAAPPSPDPQWPESTFEESGLSSGETSPVDSELRDEAPKSVEFESQARPPSAGSFDTTEAPGDISPSDWLDDLSEDADDLEDLPDWLYDAIGFTGELESPDDYEEPDWLGELEGDLEEAVRESQPEANEGDANYRNDAATNSTDGLSGTPTVGGTGSKDDEEIPDWLQGTDSSLEESPTDLVEILGAPGSDVGDEDEGALSWLEELAAESAPTDEENGPRDTGVSDRSVEKRPDPPDEPADSG